ncbi:MAG: DUF1269 domain-containing protein [Actinobacteria bacterium]|nr:MAG: DUF1269 domain-containing protein [Actinomycetota bacterium]
MPSLAAPSHFQRIVARISGLGEHPHGHVSAVVRKALEERIVDDLIVVAFPEEEHRAEEVLVELRRLGSSALVDLDDTVVVTRDGRGKVRLHQALEFSGDGARRGAFWGLLVGLVLALPFPVLGPVFIAGAAFGGTAVGAGIGALKHDSAAAGIDENFAKAVGETLTPGSSAIFMLVRGISLDAVLPVLAPYGGTLLQATLAPEAQARIASALEGTLDPTSAETESD